MAESVKRRVAAARLAVAFVAAGAIAGAAYAQAGPTPPEAQSSLLISSIKQVKLDSSNIKQNSLLFSDFKSGQIPSFKMFEKLNTSFEKFKKAESSYKAQVNGDLNAIKGELGGYVKLADADSRYIKMNDAIMGDGSVFTGDGLVSNQLIGLLDVPGLVSVEGIGTKIRITNTSNEDIQYTSCVAPAGGNVQPGTMKPTGFIECDAKDGATQNMQLFTGGVKPTVATLNFSSFPGTGGAQQDTVQILVGL